MLGRLEDNFGAFVSNSKSEERAMLLTDKLFTTVSIFTLPGAREECEEDKGAEEDREPGLGHMVTEAVGGCPGGMLFEESNKFGRNKLLTDKLMPVTYERSKKQKT